MDQHRFDKGYIMLLSILIIGAVGVAITVSVLQLGLGSSQTSFTFQQSMTAQSLVDACSERALERIRQSIVFIGSDTLSFEQGSCTYTVFNDGGSQRKIHASSTVGYVVRKSRITLDQINPVINITSWQLVEGF